MSSFFKVELIRENPDGSADYMFNFPPEALAALTRLGIMTAIQAGVGGAKRYEPDDEEEPPAPVMDEIIKCLGVEAGFIAWEDEEWHPEGVVFDWAGADDESLVNFYHLVRKEAVWECIKQLEIGKKCDPYTGSLFTCDHNDNIDYQIEVLKEHFGLDVHDSDTSQERVDETGNVNMIEPYVPTVDPRSIYARAAHVGGLGWMLKDAAHYEALMRLVDYVREEERRATTGEDIDGRC